METWKNVDGYPGYQISSFGNFRKLLNKSGAVLDNPKYIKFKINDGGYATAALWLKCKRKVVPIHRLVARAFIPNPENKPQVNHKDGNKSNNHDWNLEWCTARENIHHAFKNRLSAIGERQGSAKLSEEDVLLIRTCFSDSSYTEVAKLFSITRNTVKAVILRQNWTHI